MKLVVSEEVLIPSSCWLHRSLNRAESACDINSGSARCVSPRRTAYRLRDSGFEQLMQLPILSLSVVVSLAFHQPWVDPIVVALVFR